MTSEWTSEIMHDLFKLLSNPLSSGILAFIVCVVITPLVIRYSTYKKWVVAPREDRWHKKPTALMGGIGIFVAYSIALFISIFISGISNIVILIYVASSIMFITGLIDDLKEIKPIVKLLVQVVCSFILLYCGFNFGGGLLGWAGIPLTFFWVIGITNAINLLDNMDGLATGISCIIAIISGIIALSGGDYTIASMAFALAGSTMGFLVYNFKPAKIFMGDCGSLFLGFSLCFLSISVQGNTGSSSAILMLLIPISLMAIPIMDTTLVTVKRIVAGRRIDQGGRDHTSHRLVALGMTEKRAVITLYIISAVWGILCILMYKIQINNLLLCIVLLTIFSGLFSIVLSKVKVYNETEEKLIYLRYRGQKSGDNFLLRFFLFHKKLIAGIFIDILIIYCAFIIATKSMGIDPGKDYIILGIFIFIKISLFYFFNLYYSLWRYMGTMDLTRYFVATCISAVLLSILFFFYGENKDLYSSYFFMVDALLTFTGVIFSRVAYRWLIEALSTVRECHRRVIIYGAGDRGYLLIKELQHNDQYNFKPVGWIDDDPAKHNMYMCGIKVYGGVEKLSNACYLTNADLVLISTNLIDQENDSILREQLSSKQIELGRFSINLSILSARVE